MGTTPVSSGASPQELEHLRLRFIEISGTNTLFPRILSLRRAHSALSQFSDVYFSPLHMHWLIGTFSFVGEGTGPIPTYIDGCPVFLQDTRAILPADPDAPIDILSFSINPAIPLNEEEVREIRNLFPRCMSLTVKSWGHVSIFFRKKESVDAATRMEGLPRRLGGLTYSFELKSYDQPLVRRQPSLGSDIGALCGRVTGTVCAFISKLTFRNTQQ